MRVTLWPFYSQQDKRYGHFLDTCSTVKAYRYIAGKLRDELGWDAAMAVPLPAYRKWEADVRDLPIPYMPTDNRLRRLHWDTKFLELVAERSDLVITSNDFAAIPLRMLKPSLKVVTEASVLPGTAWKEQDDLFYLAWKASDALHCNNNMVRSAVAPHAKRTFLWQFSYPDDMVVQGRLRDIEVVFSSRCSATNYSHHQEFLAATKGLRRIVCDPTGFLGGKPMSREQYIDSLLRSKTTVCLTVGGGSTHSLREAVVCGCLPVTLRAPEYEELLTDRWPYFCSLDNIRAVVSRAVQKGWNSVPADVAEAVVANLRRCSYSEAWVRAKEDLLCLS